MLGYAIFPLKELTRKLGEDSALGKATKILEEFQAGKGEYPGKLSSQRKSTSPLSPLSNQAGKKSIRVIYLSITISQGRRRGRGYIGIIIGIRPVSQL
jgi:hypothetical protein